ncbi:MAG TPA: MAPEG family protein [Caulobacteraceae bacterium]|jgi:glutathione S-transferase|nr:MAPEG family protein [Caulobacteraceae bacterium]
MMLAHPWTALVTVLALLVYFYMGLRVGQGRSKYNIVAPAVSGHPEFERAFRIHANTLEWLPLFLVSLWLFSFYVGDLWAAGVGVLWIVGRVLYLAGYTKAAAARGPGFGIQALATAILLFGSLGRIIWSLAQSGGR